MPGCRSVLLAAVCSFSGVLTGCGEGTEPPLVGVIDRVSIGSDGAVGSGGSSFLPSISADGRHVAFTSAASNLVTGDTNAAWDTFVRDTCIGATGCTPSTTRVSVATDGTESNSGSGADFSSTSISADGRFVAYRSSASNLVAGDINVAPDIFVRDTCIGTTGCTPSTIRVSVADDGTQGNSVSTDPSISGDGRFVSFRSGASNLVAGDTNGLQDIFVRDTCIGATGCTPSTACVSVATDGTEGNSDSSFPSISANGRFVTFASSASNLVAGDTNATADIFVRDTCFGATGCTPSTIRVSVASDGAQANERNIFPSISADGRFVAFLSSAANLITNDANSVVDDVFVRDTCLGATGCTPSTSLVSVATDGAQANNGSFFLSISADGRFVAYDSFASNLGTGDTNDVMDVFVHDTCQGVTECTPSTVRVSVTVNGSQGNDFSLFPSISVDGRFVAFESLATNLVPGDTNGVEQVLVARTGF